MINRVDIAVGSVLQKVLSASAALDGAAGQAIQTSPLRYWTISVDRQCQLLFVDCAGRSDALAGYAGKFTRSLARFIYLVFVTSVVSLSVGG